MTLLLETTIPRTVTIVEQRLQSAEADSFLHHHIWLFEPAQVRRDAEARLKLAGIIATLHSAYKPLVHAFLEELSLEGVDAIDVIYPVIDGVPPERFLLECYPVDALVGDRPLTFMAQSQQMLTGTTSSSGATSNGVPPIAYEVVLHTSNAEPARVLVPAPNRWVHSASHGPLLRNCAWHHDALFSDLETVFDTVMQSLDTHSWTQGTHEPYDNQNTSSIHTQLFDQLDIVVAGPFQDEELPVGSECISLAETLHEEFYFAALELFAYKQGLKAGSRELCPGQVVPQLQTTTNGDWQVRVSIGKAEVPASDSGVDADAGTIFQTSDTTAVTSNVMAAALQQATHWLTPNEIALHLEAMGGALYQVRSCRGRAVTTRYIHCDNNRAQVVISAGQHANETSGPVGVLRAAWTLKDEQGIGFALTPMLNPDGYALFQECCIEHPNHMHHAARYTALGNDLEVGSHQHEKGALIEAVQRTTATLHINCHGYPSHEWVRPFSGYIPHGFGLWTIPKGFFLIMRYAEGYYDEANHIIDTCVAALNDYEPIMALNREQLARYAIYSPSSGVEIRRNVPVFLSQVDNELFPMTLITEAPDETVYDELFITLHEAQRRVVLAAAMTQIEGQKKVTA